MDDPKVVLTLRADGAMPQVGQSGVEVVMMRWWTQAMIRGSRVYLQNLVGFLLATGSGAAAAVGVSLPAMDFYHVLLASSSLALAPAVIAVLQNAVEILSKLDATAPRMRA